MKIRTTKRAHIQVDWTRQQECPTLPLALGSVATVDLLFLLQGMLLLYLLRQVRLLLCELSWLSVLHLPF